MFNCRHRSGWMIVLALLLGTLLAMACQSGPPTAIPYFVPTTPGPTATGSLIMNPEDPLPGLWTLTSVSITGTESAEDEVHSRKWVAVRRYGDSYTYLNDYGDRVTVEDVYYLEMSSDGRSFAYGELIARDGPGSYLSLPCKMCPPEKVVYDEEKDELTIIPYGLFGDGFVLVYQRATERPPAPPTPSPEPSAEPYP